MLKNNGKMLIKIPSISPFSMIVNSIPKLLDETEPITPRPSDENISGNKRKNYSEEYKKYVQEKKFKVYKNPELVELVTGVVPEQIDSKYDGLVNFIDNSDEKKYLDCEFIDSNYSVINLSKDKDKTLKDFNASFTWKCPCDYEYFIMVTSSFSSTGAIEESTRCAQHVISTVCKFFPQIALHNIPKNYHETDELIDMEVVLTKLITFVNASCKMNTRLLKNSEASMCVSVICKSDNLMTTVNIGNTKCMIIGKNLNNKFINKFETMSDSQRFGKDYNIDCKTTQIYLFPNDTLIQFSNKFLLAPVKKNNKPGLSYKRDKQNIVCDIKKYYITDNSICLASFLADSFINETIYMCKLLQIRIPGVSNMYNYLLSWISNVSIQTYSLIDKSNESDESDIFSYSSSDSDIFNDYEDF